MRWENQEPVIIVGIGRILVTHDVSIVPQARLQKEFALLEGHTRNKSDIP